MPITFRFWVGLLAALSLGAWLSACAESAEAEGDDDGSDTDTDRDSDSDNEILPP